MSENRRLSCRYFHFCQIRNALEKERESADLERTRHQAKLEEIRDKYESALKQVREELESEREDHSHLNASVNKIKKVSSPPVLHSQNQDLNESYVVLGS